MQSFKGRSADSSAETFALAVQQYALEMNEPPHIVDRALNCLVRSHPTLTVHPVASGLLAREIAALREQRDTTAPSGGTARLFAAFGSTRAHSADRNAAATA